MTNKLYESTILISLIFIPILFSCATTQQKQGESKDAEFFNNRGAIYAAKGQYDQAISDFNKALEMSPNYAFDYSNQGTANMNKAQYDQAIYRCSALSSCLTHFILGARCTSLNTTSNS